MLHRKSVGMAGSRSFTIDSTSNTKFTKSEALVFSIFYAGVAHVELPTIEDRCSKTNGPSDGWSRITDKIASVPGVGAVSLTTGAKPLDRESALIFWREGQPKPPNEVSLSYAVWYRVGPDTLKS
jgi:hypothetical protein